MPIANFFSLPATSPFLSTILAKPTCSIILIHTKKIDFPLKGNRNVKFAKKPPNQRQGDKMLQGCGIRIAPIMPTRYFLTRADLSLPCRETITLSRVFKDYHLFPDWKKGPTRVVLGHRWQSCAVRHGPSVVYHTHNATTRRNNSQSQRQSSLCTKDAGSQGRTAPRQIS